MLKPFRTLACLAFVLSLAPWPAAAQPVGGGMFAGVTAVERDGCYVLDVGFNTVVQYMRHFPPGSGEQLLVFIRPISLSSSGPSISVREAAALPPEAPPMLETVVYEGDLAFGQALSLLFSQPVFWRVRQGCDFRSITIEIKNTGSPDTCMPSCPEQ